MAEIAVSLPAIILSPIGIMIFRKKLDFPQLFCLETKKARGTSQFRHLATAAYKASQPAQLGQRIGPNLLGALL